MLTEDAVYLTEEGFVRLEEELRMLVQVRRPQVAEMIRNAKEDGDVMENAAYDEAKDQQAFVEGRIIHLEDLLKRAIVIEEPPPDDSVHLGSLVTVAEGDEEAESFRIVGSAEADPRDGRISNESPIGRALIGKRVGDTATYNTPDGETLVFKIIGIA